MSFSLVAFFGYGKVDEKASLFDQMGLFLHPTHKEGDEALPLPNPAEVHLARSQELEVDVREFGTGSRTDMEESIQGHLIHLAEELVHELDGLVPIFFLDFS